MQVAFLMELFEPNNNLGKDFSCLLEGEYSVFKFSLVVDEISPITILQNEIDALLVFSNVIELDNILGVHCLHALDFPIEILPKMGLILNHLHGDELQGQQLSLLILDQIDIAVCTLPQPTLVLVLVQKHQRYYNKSNLTHLFINKL